MALSILRYGVRCSRNAGLFDKKIVLGNVAITPKRPSSNFLTDPCKCASVLSVTNNQETKIARKYSQQKYASESESDSDLDVRGRRGNSDFWRRKMRTFHGILDVNNDGVISFDDFKLLAERFVNLGHLSEQHTVEFIELVKDLWEKRWGEITPYNLVTVEQYLEDMHHVLNDKKLVRRAHSFLPYLFRAIDKDKSETLSLDEYKLFFECLGLLEEDAVFAFRAIDSNGDGKITLKEFLKHGRDFFLTEDENRISKYFWGPLVP